MKYLLLAVLISGILSLHVFPPKIVNPIHFTEKPFKKTVTKPVKKTVSETQKKKVRNPVFNTKPVKPVQKTVSETFKKLTKPVFKEKEPGVVSLMQFTKLNKKKDAEKVGSPDCSKCLFAEQGCPKTCSPLCEPAVYPKCPLCKSQEHCDWIKVIDVPAPDCDDGSDKCSGKGANLDRCSFEMSTWIYDVFKAHPSDMDKVFDGPPRKDTPAASSLACKCYNRQLNCMLDNIDNGCIANETSASLQEGAEEDIHIMKDLCYGKMKCARDQCAFIDRFKGKIIEGKNFLKFARIESFLP